MEKIKVNMTPNPLDVQTIHASQNDGEARQWEFELHNNGELIDTSEVKEQLVFKAYKGGTEQLLPENGAVPVTAHFVGDIKYPDATRTDQEFTYRESPTEEDGYAKIETIYGNTIVWNQLYSPAVLSGNTSGVTRTQTADGLLTLNGTANATGVQILSNADFPVVSGHKYLVKTSEALGYQCLQLFNVDGNVSAQAFGNQNAIYSATASFTARIRLIVLANQTYNNISCYINIFDLTKMFGAGNEPATVEEFTSLFPLPYYAYNQGSLLSFNGNGIKTVGFNQWDEEWQLGNINVTTGEFEYTNDMFCSKNFIPVLPETDYFMINPTSSTFKTRFYDASMNYIGPNDYNETGSIPVGGRVFKTPSNCCYFKFATQSGVNVYNNNICLNISNPARNGEYKPYKESSLSLPISQYFPTGMKSAGSVYDELTPTKAITRIGSVDLGTLDWTPSNASSHIFRGKLAGTNAKIPNANDLPNALLAYYLPYGYGPISGNNNGCFAIGYRNATDGNVIIIIDNNYSDRESFISHISGQYLFYELATPTETSFTTASLVTENAEIPLSNEDGTLIGKCTEELSENPGFIDAKIKLTDSDGECYSNKLQLHVERSPQ